MAARVIENSYNVIQKLDYGYKIVMVRERIEAIVSKYKQLPISVKATVWFFACEVIRKMISMVTVPITTRLLTPDEYGYVSVFQSYESIMLVICTLNVFGNGYYVGINKYENDKKFSSSVAGIMSFSISLFLITSLLCNNIIEKYTGFGVPIIIILYLSIFGQGMSNLWFTKERHEFNYRQIVYMTLAVAIITPVLKILLIIFFGEHNIYRPFGAIIGDTVPIFVLGIISGIFLLKLGKAVYKKEYWKFVIKFNVPLTPYYLSQIILNQADRIMVNSLASESSAGLYSVAYSLANVVGIVGVAIINSFTPWQFNKMKSKCYRELGNAIKGIIIGLFFIHLVFLLAVPDLMKIFAAKAYFESIFAVPPITIGVMMTWITQIYINIEFYFEKNKLIPISSIASALFNLLLNYLLIPRYGYIAAAYTTLLCYISNLVLHMCVSGFISRKNGVENNVSPITLAGMIGMSVTGMFLMLLMYRNDPVRWVVIGTICVAGIVFRRKMIKSVKEIFRI